MQPIDITAKKSGKEVLFALVRADIKDPEGHELLPLVLIRGAAVVIVPVIENVDTGICRFLMVRQRRSGNGHNSLEFPAGMLDDEVAHPAKVAIKELKEETGLDLKENELIPLTDKPLYSSPGLSDESIFFYAAHVLLTNEEMEDLNGRLTGVSEEGERIRVELHSGQGAMNQVTSLQVQLAYRLFKEQLEERFSSSAQLWSGE